MSVDGDTERAVQVVSASTSKAKKFTVPNRKNLNTVPASILDDPRLQKELSKLPSNYNFEIPKTIWRIQQLKANTVALQMPEGLTMFACTIADILEMMTDCFCIIMGDVTYGACCIDDYVARALEVDLLVHYGHSCLVPVNETPGIKVLYVFVDIQIDIVHFLDTVIYNFEKGSKIALVSTIQFVPAVQSATRELCTQGFNAFTPQSRPLSPGLLTARIL